MPKSATSELAEHSTSIGPQSWGEGSLSKMDTASHPQPAGLPGVAPESQRLEGPLWKDQQLGTGEAIIVGAIGSAAPWFLTGWAHAVEIEFMIDTGCQVTNLSTTVFERMCVVDPTVRSELRPTAVDTILSGWIFDDVSGDSSGQ